MYKLKVDINEKEDFIEFFGKPKEEMCKELYKYKDAREFRQALFDGAEYLDKNSLHFVYEHSEYCAMFLNTITNGWFTNGIAGNDGEGRKKEHLIFKIAKKKFPDVNSCKILDWGCGQGENGLGLAFLGYDVTLADIPHKYFKFLQFLCKKYLSELKINFVSITNKEYVLNEVYDYIVSDEMLEHACEPELTIRHLRDHLKEEGLIYLSYFFDDMRGADPSHLKYNTQRYNDAQRFVGILADNRLIPAIRDHNGIIKCYQKLSGNL